MIIKNLLTASFVTRFLYIACGFFSSIFINRGLGPELKGVYTLIITLSGFSVMFFEFGMPFSSIYFYGRKKIKFSDLFHNSIFLSIVFSVLAVFFAYLFIINSQNNIYKEISWGILILLFLLIPIELFGHVFRSFIDALQEYKLILSVVLFQAIFTLCGTFIVLYVLKYSIKLLLIVIFLGIFFSNTIIFWKIRKKISSKIKISLNKIKKIIIYGFKNYLFCIVSNLNVRMDFLIIGYFLNPFYVGLYSLSKKIAELSKELPIALNTILIPKISSGNKKDTIYIINKSTRLNIFISILTGIFLVVFGKVLISFLYGNAFSPSYMPLLFLVPAMIFFNPIDLLGSFFNLYLGKPMINFWVNFSALVLNFMLNIILIPVYKIQGAALAAGISYFVNSMIQYFLYMKYAKVSVFELFVIKWAELAEYYTYLKNMLLLRIKQNNVRNSGNN